MKAADGTTEAWLISPDMERMVRVSDFNDLYCKYVRLLEESAKMRALVRSDDILNEAMREYTTWLTGGVSRLLWTPERILQRAHERRRGIIGF